jgi:hypothetical protein
MERKRKFVSVDRMCRMLMICYAHVLVTRDTERKSVCLYVEDDDDMLYIVLPMFWLPGIRRGSLCVPICVGC